MKTYSAFSNFKVVLLFRLNLNKSNLQSLILLRFLAFIYTKSFIFFGLVTIK